MTTKTYVMLWKIFSILNWYNLATTLLYWLLHQHASSLFNIYFHMSTYDFLHFNVGSTYEVNVQHMGLYRAIWFYMSTYVFSCCNIGSSLTYEFRCCNIGSYGVRCNQVSTTERFLGNFTGSKFREFRVFWTTLRPSSCRNYCETLNSRNLWNSWWLTK